MPKFTQYSIRDSFENLNRQDQRELTLERQSNLTGNENSNIIPIPGNSRGDYRKRYENGIQKTPPSPSIISEIEYDPNECIPAITIHQKSIEQFKLLPPFLKRSINKLSKQYAITQCKILNIQDKQNNLKSNKDANTLQTHMKHQQKLVDKFTDIHVIHKLIHNFIDVEYESLLQLLESLNVKLNERHSELLVMLEPISSNTRLLNNTELDLTTIFDAVIEEEFCNMLMKQRDDKLRKAIKKEKFETMKAKNNALATITVKDLNNIKKQIKQVKKPTPPTKPKIGKGKTCMKKPALPKTNKGKKQTKQ
jgi:hypothetical protein